MNFITPIASLRKQQLLNCATWNLERAEQAGRNGETKDAARLFDQAERLFLQAWRVGQ